MPHDKEKQGDIITAANVDLSNCDRELIHIPGLVQPHGVMLVLRATDLALLQASENVTMLGVSPSELASKGLVDLLGQQGAVAVNDAIVRADDRLIRGPLHLLQIPSTPDRASFDVIAHRAGDVLLLELELVRSIPSRKFNAYHDLADFMAALQISTSVRQFLDLAVEQVRTFSGFDRVMAYQFAEDGSGEVVAEARRGDLNAYLGMHFPASDIPAPARRLFALSWLRHLPDVEYTPIHLVPEADHPVDMSRSLLRHVSVMYSSYLKNMKVRATMVIPLMKAGRLWGLISCMHHAAPLHVPCETRSAIELLAHMVSSLMAEQEDRDTAAYRERMNQVIAGLDRQMAQEPDYHHGLSKGDFGLHGWLEASGAALVTEGAIVLLGQTPTERQVRSLAEWLSEQDFAVPVLATDRLTRLYPPAELFRNTASGLMAARLMQSRCEFIMWFRAQIMQTIDWAGDPNKPVQVNVVDGKERLTPRVSFTLWQETVQGRSAPWLACEIDAARSLRQAIADVVLIRQNKALEQSNNELDSFAYIASHDLKEPLRGIHNFAHFLQQSAVAKLTSEELGRLQTIIRLTQRMDDLTDALLQYSRVGQTELVLEPVDVDQLLTHTLDLLAARIAESGTIVRMPHRFSLIRTDRVSLTSVFTNLIVNALKYNSRPPGERWIEIGWREDGGRTVFYVSDNGIGIVERHLEQVFQIFRRLHARSEYGGGNGAGLTIARRTVDRLGGRLWAESGGLGNGSTFLFTLGGSLADGGHP